MSPALLPAPTAPGALLVAPEATVRTGCRALRREWAEVPSRPCDRADVASELAAAWRRDANRSQNLPNTCLVTHALGRALAGTDAPGLRTFLAGWRGVRSSHAGRATLRV